jgi:hypothetical protein
MDINGELWGFLNKPEMLSLYTGWLIETVIMDDDNPQYIE